MPKNNYRYHAKVFWQLLRTELILLKDGLWNKLFNSFIWTSTTVAISSYALPSFGLDLAYGPFIAASTVASSGAFAMYAQVTGFIADLDGDQHIAYHLTLPIPVSLVFIKKICFYALDSIILTLGALVTAKAVLFTRLNISAINFFQLGIAIVVNSIFFGTFALFMASLTKSILDLEDIFMRFLYPLWILGCFQFSWLVAYKLSKVLGYVFLLNPFTYTMEVIRASMLGQQGFLPFWASIGALLTITVMLGWWGMRRLKRRLDYVS